jgi:Tol biopolymer transport system component
MESGGTFFAPDGEAVLYIEGGQMRRTAISGGASLALASVSSLLGATTNADGTILYGSIDGVWQIAADGGAPERLITIDAGEFAVAPHRLPRGDWILYSVMRFLSGRINSVEPLEVVVESPASGERRALGIRGSDARYLPTGHLVYANEGVLYAVRFDVDRLEIVGSPVSVVEGVRSTVTGLSQFDISAAGHLVYVPGPAVTPDRGLSIGIADRSGTLTQLVPAGPYGHVRAAPDGARLAIDSDDGDEAIVWIYDVGGGSAMRRLTFGGRNQFPVWSPGGERVAFQSDRDGDLGIYAQRVDGVGGAERLTTAADGEAHIPESWSPDGKYLSFAVVDANTWTLSILSLEDGVARVFGSVQSIEPPGSVFSPDGKWIAYHVLREGADALTTASGVFVEPFPEAEAVYQAPKVTRDFQPLWSRDGAELYYVGTTMSGQLAAVAVSMGSGVSFGNTELIPFALTAGRLSGAVRAFDVLPDGRFVGPVTATALEATADSPSEVRLVVNWFEELKRLVPTD